MGWLLSMRSADDIAPSPLKAVPFVPEADRTAGGEASPLTDEHSPVKKDIDSCYDAEIPQGYLGYVGRTPL